MNFALSGLHALVASKLRAADHEHCVSCLLRLRKMQNAVDVAANYQQCCHCMLSIQTATLYHCIKRASGSRDIARLISQLSFDQGKKRYSSAMTLTAYSTIRTVSRFGIHLDGESEPQEGEKLGAARYVIQMMLKQNMAPQIAPLLAAYFALTEEEQNVVQFPVEITCTTKGGDNVVAISFGPR